MRGTGTRACLRLSLVLGLGLDASVAVRATASTSYLVVMSGRQGGRERHKVPISADVKCFPAEFDDPATGGKWGHCSACKGEKVPIPPELISSCTLVKEGKRGWMWDPFLASMRHEYLDCRKQGDRRPPPNIPINQKVHAPSIKSRRNPYGEGSLISSSLCGCQRRMLRVEEVHLV